ncbi:MAG: bacteriohemerythrin [bacterium]
MSLIKWNDNFSVNVEKIDNQHRKLISMINELNDKMRQGKGKEVLEKIISDLINYTAIHFQTEEKLFEKFRYPETAVHKKEHTDFVRKVSDFQKNFKAGKLGLSIDIMSFLSSWLKNHIKGTDKKYSEFFKEKGIE